MRTQQGDPTEQGATPAQLSRGDQRRHDLIRAAYQIIAEQGFEGLRVRMVAAQAGVNIATLHYYFPGKEDLIRGVVDYLLDLFLTVTVPPSDAGERTALDELRQIFVDLQHQLHTVPQMFMVLNELHLRSQRDPAVRALLKQLNDGWQTYIEHICDEGQRQHLLRSDLDPQRTAQEVIALIKGISMQAISHLGTYDIEQIGTDFVQWVIAPTLSMVNKHQGGSNT